MKWPGAEAVDAAVKDLAGRLASGHPELVCFGYFGSYARGDWGVGSDVDLVALVTDSTVSFPERAGDFDLSGLPVPADLLIYTIAEWTALQAEAGPFARVLAREAKWVWGKLPGAAGD
jgi:predicted nucleotidyltransferase